MKALVYHGPWKLLVEERPDPRPAPDEVVVHVRATGICGSDLHGFTGENGRRHPGQVMGHETVGTVGATGAAVRGLDRGEVVTINPVLSCRRCANCRSGAQQRCVQRRVVGVDPSLSSAFAELVVVPAVNVHPLGDVPPDHGALIEPLAVGYHAARTGACSPRDSVAVLGGGPIGQASALAARRCGAETVVVSEPDPRRRQLLADLGLAVVDPSAGPVAESAADALGGPPTLVIDAVGTSRTVTDALATCAEGGTVVLVGMHSPQIELPAYTLTTAERSLLGSYCYSDEHFEQTVAWVGRGADGAGQGGLERLVEGRVGLGEAADAFSRLARGEDPASKVLVMFDVLS